MLPPAVREMADTTDDEARDDIIKAARNFLKEVLASKGRRTDVESNAFWAAALALIPADVLVNRKGRAVMRLLDIDYRVIKKASEMRGALDDGSRRWSTVKTSRHSDVSEWSLVVNWLHSDEASHEDNTHKAPVRIDITTNLSAKAHIYELHTARTYNDTKIRLYKKFLASTTFTAMGEKYKEKKVALRLVQARFRARKMAGADAEVLKCPCPS